MIFKYGSRVARMTAAYANTFTDILKTTAGYHYLCPVLLLSWQNFPYPAAFFISNIYAGFLLFKKKTASELPFLETRTFRLHRNRRIASGVLKRLRNVPPFFSSKLPQQVSHLSCAVFPSTRMVFLQQQFSALCIHPVTLQSSFVMIFPPVFWHASPKVSSGIQPSNFSAIRFSMCHGFRCCSHMYDQ